MTSVVVHHRKIIDADGHTLVEEVVDCPRDGRVRQLAACSWCGHAKGLIRDDEQGDTLLCGEGDAVAPAPLIELRRDPRATLFPGVTVADACQRDVICALPEAPIAAISAALREHAVGTVVIVDPVRAPLGVVSAQDIVALPIGARVAAEAMTTRPISVPFDFPLGRAAALMAFEGIHHLPVVGPDSRLLGILSSIDILRRIGWAEGMIVPPQTARRRLADRENG